MNSKVPYLGRLGSPVLVNGTDYCVGNGVRKVLNA